MELLGRPSNNIFSPIRHNSDDLFIDSSSVLGKVEIILKSERAREKERKQERMIEIKQERNGE